MAAVTWPASAVAAWAVISGTRATARPSIPGSDNLSASFPGLPELQVERHPSPLPGLARRVSHEGRRDVNKRYLRPGQQARSLKYHYAELRHQRLPGRGRARLAATSAPATGTVGQRLAGRAPACSVNVRTCPNRGRGGRGLRREWRGPAGPRGCAGSRRLMAAMIAARMVARLAGPLPVRLVAVSSVKVTSRMWWCASMVQCSRTSRARSGGWA
jgi:hypothetical protein